MVTGEQILRSLKSSTNFGPELREQAMELLAKLHGYDWCGVYRLEPDGLHLDEYVGAQTDHTLIPIGRGVCGTAVSENRNQVIDDVRELENYLSCSAQTRSEIVVLIREKGGRVLGQIDIDGHEVAAFDEADETFLEEVAAILAERWE